jgi:hypothetical protein
LFGQTKDTVERPRLGRLIRPHHLRRPKGEGTCPPARKMP